MNTITFLKNKLMLFASIIFCIQGFAQNQSMLLPVPGIYSTSTNDYEGCKIINFINPGNPVIYELPKHTFYVEGIKDVRMLNMIWSMLIPQWTKNTSDSTLCLHKILCMIKTATCCFLLWIIIFIIDMGKHL